MQINGPYNVVRLEGTVNNIKKIFYLYFDVHYDLQNQYTCPDALAVDIKDYLINEFKKVKKDKPVDFIFETDLIATRTDINTFYKHKYIHEVVKLFDQAINIDKDKIKMSKIFPNVRLHAMEIRYHLPKNIKSFLLDNLLSEILNKSDYEIGITKIITDLEQFYELLNSTTPIKIKKIEKDLKKKYKSKVISKYLLNKMLFKYKNINIKNILVPPILFLLNKYLKESIKLLHRLLYLQKKRNNVQSLHFSLEDTLHYTNNIYQLKETFENISIYTEEFHCLYYDLFTLRRLLDKEYITHAIIYTGGSHSINYIYFLIKYFDFNITHASYIDKNINFKEIHNIIRKKESPDQIRYIFEHDRYQCSDISSFPEITS